MSLKSRWIGDVPAETAAVAHAVLPKGNVYMQMRDVLGTIYDNEDFEDLYPERGQPALAPWRLALVSVMQFAEGLSDRQTADAVRTRIDWKYALGLELTDPGFNFSVLSEFRSRLLEGEAERRLLDRMLDGLNAQGLLKARGRQRTDSTHILTAARVMRRLEMIGETLRAALNALAAAAPEAWEVVESELQNEIYDFQNLKKQFEAAFDNLCKSARIELQLPTSNSPKKLSFLSQVRCSVTEQRQEYRQALDKYLKVKNPEMFSNEIMRIAYNFSSDATKVLQVLVSIADLKGVMLWCTIKEHFDIAQAFRDLPVIRDKDKPSLKDYEKIISGARNHAFHNLFNFDRTIEARIDGIQFTARSLTIMPPYSGTRNKKSISFHYDDREVVEVLSELSRAPEKSVPLEFWKKNVTVMETFEKLLECSEATLWALHAALQRA